MLREIRWFGWFLIPRDGQTVLGGLSPAFGEIAVGVDPAVAEEWPDPAEVLDGLEIQIVEEDLLAVRAGFGDQFAIGVGDE
jgi:hypothetical protein